MPRLLNWCIDIEPTASPVQHLLPNVVDSLARIAPERLVDLAERSAGLTVKISDSPNFRCETLPSLKVIHLSRRVVELAWAFGFAYWELYRVVLAGRMPSGSSVDLHSFVELKRVLPLLKWALDELTLAKQDEWPNGAPRPHAHRTNMSAEHVADEVALCAVAMYLHHELAHVYAPRDERNMTDREEEEYCDASAAEWILSAPGLNAEVVQKRAWGVAVGMLMLTARGLGGTTSDGVHPHGYERLVAALNGRVPADQEAVWGLVTGMLALHVSWAKLPPHTVEYQSFRDAAMGYCAHIRRCLISDGNV